MARPSKKRFELDKEIINKLKKYFNVKKITDIDVAVLKKFREKLKKIEDHRVKHKCLYKIWDIIIYVIIGKLAGNETWEEIAEFVEDEYAFFRSALLMTGGVPSSYTIERIFSIISHKELEEILVEFYFEISNLANNQDKTIDIINLDGRTSNGSSRAETRFNDKIKALNVLNAYSNKYGICLASEKIEDKTNEIPTIPIILERFNIKNTIITWDALNTQKSNIEAVIEKGGDYVVPIKGNHKMFYNELKEYFNEEKINMITEGEKNSAKIEQFEKRGSDIIKYEYYQTSDIKWFQDKDDWKKLSTIGMVRKTIERGNKKVVETRYYISSLKVSIYNFANAIRNHWSVENKLHWHLDFTFNQDKNKTVNKNALMNLELVNKFCLSILNKVKKYYNKSLIRIRKKFGRNLEKELVNILCFLNLEK